MIGGIDVSAWQGDIDWAAVAGSGVRFAIVRVAVRSGDEPKTDTRFKANLEAAGDNGILRGVYMYVSATDADTGLSDALFLISALDGAALELPVFYDLENSALSSVAKGNEEYEKYLAGMRIFMETVEKAGYRAGLYTASDEADVMLKTDAAGNSAGRTVWLADYSADPDGFDFGGTFRCLQYSNTGKVAGISGAVDLDRMIIFIKATGDE